jgi:hypothetical protein
MGRTGKTEQTRRNCQAAFSIGFCQLLILSCLRGKAQLPEVSGIQAIVL